MWSAYDDKSNWINIDELIFNEGCEPEIIFFLNLHSTPAF